MAGKRKSHSAVFKARVALEAHPTVAHVGRRGGVLLSRPPGLLVGGKRRP